MTAVILTILLPLLATVESNGNPNAIGDNGQAVGIYQIHPAYVEDVNRIAGTQFTLADRTDPHKSRIMVLTYLQHYGKRYTRITGKPATLEVLARIHNGGPDGWKKNATLKYWQKIASIK